MLRQRRTAQALVDGESNDQACEPDADCRGVGERHHGGVDQEDLRLGVVHEYEQREAGNPGPVRLPLEPVQRLRQLDRGQAVLLRAVKAAAVNRMQLAGELRVLRRLEMVVEPDEVERSADPSDADHDVRPAH
jgi:hypothetical protein